MYPDSQGMPGQQGFGGGMPGGNSDGGKVVSNIFGMIGKIAGTVSEYMQSHPFS
eukprot:CAMPEP_0114646874 /NCGR_PEP_ID=MMETSP0191-20121206/5435_1 /TAXON_ID=126664 /ORGANISM="Sorites sp." /LENGTH=53 /DNA_ID=CAMNT_0001859835 /DNA_START=83 /DNA_END=244 /DNA_ORIENTATION=-